MKRGRPPILDDVKLAAALTKAGGNLTVVAEQFDVSRAAIQKRVAASPSLSEVLSDARESTLDRVESRFQADCLKDNPAYQTSRIFYLKTKGKARGYVERQELTGADGDAVQLSIREVIVARDVIAETEGGRTDDPSSPDATGLLP